MIPWQTIVVKSFQQYWRYSRGLMLDVQAIVLDGAGRVLLVPRDHTLWDLPGGPVESGEAAEIALKRILRHEAGIALATRPILSGIHLNDDRAAPHGHAVLYIVQEWQEAEYPLVRPDRHFFAADNLPQAIEASARARLAHALDRTI